MPGISRHTTTGGFSLQPQHVAAAGTHLREVFGQLASIEPAELSGPSDRIGDRRLARALERCGQAWRQSLALLVSEGEWLHRQLTDTATLATDTDTSIADRLRATNTTTPGR